MEFHYVICLQFKTPVGNSLSWANGVWHASLRDTRDSIYRTLREQIISGHPELVDRNPAPLFFTLEPNRLPLAV